MKILYKPFALVASFISARIGRSVFRSLWARIDASEPPATTAPDATLQKVVSAAALEAATMAGIAAAVDRAAVRTFHYLTGIWPGEKKKQAGD